MVAFGEQRDRFNSAAELQRYAGIAPVTERSGNETLETFFHQHNMRFAHVLEDRIQAIKGASPLTLDDAVITPHRLQAVVLVDHWRWQCPTFLRQTFVEWAGQTINKSFWAGAYYQQQRDKGCSYNAAVRALAFKWIRILYRCWQTRTPYDEATYLKALKRRGSPLVNPPAIVEIA